MSKDSSPVSRTEVKNYTEVFPFVVDTSDKLITGPVHDTGDKFMTGAKDTRDKFTACVVDSAINLTPVSTTPMIKK